VIVPVLVTIAGPDSSPSSRSFASHVPGLSPVTVMEVMVPELVNVPVLLPGKEME
jgi:hypothetical protein